MAQILIIDDDDQLRRMMRQMLEGAGHTVTEAEDGRRGFEAFSAEPSDLVVTNLFMPERDGLEVIKAVRGSGAAVPIVLVSGAGAAGAPSTSYASNMFRIAEKFGASRVLQKPFDRDALVGTISDLLARGPGAAPGPAGQAGR